MSMQHLTKKCPYCGRIYEQRSYGSVGRKKPAPEDAWVYGSPMKLCGNCKRIFIDMDVKELAITELRKSDTAKITASTRTLLPMGALVALLLYVLGQPTFAIVAAAVAVVYLAMDLGMYPMRMGKLRKERAASEKRLSDPDYARALKKAGIDVPERYLKNESKGKDEEK